MRFGLKWVAVNSNELKLWENDGTGLKIISRCLPGQKLKKTFFFLLKIALTPISIAGNMVSFICFGLDLSPQEPPIVAYLTCGVRCRA